MLKHFPIKFNSQIKLTYTQLIALSFLAVILVGTFLLCLPVSSRSGQWTPFVDSLFTATSATCVTGLIVQNTCMYWSVFGQIVILFMIQIGGLGFMTVITMFYFIAGKRLKLHEQRLLMQSAGNTQIGGMSRLIRNVLLGTLIFEGAGIIVLALRFCPSLGLKGLWFSVFHSVSAFCNAGFDLMGGLGQSSFTAYYDDPIVNLTLIFLIVMGGIGFLVWSDLLHCKHHVSKYKLHTKIVLVSTAVLIVAGTVLFYLFEQKNTLAGMSEWKQWLASLFQSVSPRTAGFNTVPLDELSDSGSLLTVILMFIGGSPGSCAGGVKTTTVAVVLIGALGYARNGDNVVFFKRKLNDDIVHQAYVILMIYLLGVVSATTVICAIEPFGVKQVLFEVVSAIGTVGLTMGVTPQLSTASRIIIILLMYMGRIGGLSLILAIAQKKTKVPLNRPSEKILIG